LLAVRANKGEIAMRTRTLIGAGLAVALAGALLSYQLPAFAHGPGGWGTMGGYGAGSHMGWGGGYGHGMMGHGYGHGMMGHGYGSGYDRSGVTQRDLKLTTDDVKARMERWLTWRGNPRLKVGEVKEKDADTITADIVTKNNGLVERFIVDRRTGYTRPDNG
jgi:hypothetical protein